MDTIQIRATKDQINDLKESIIWADIIQELESWSHGFNLEMMSIVDESATSNPSTASVLLHMGDLNGRQKAVQYFVGILDVFLDVLNTKKETNLEVSDDK